MIQIPGKKKNKYSWYRLVQLVSPLLFAGLLAGLTYLSRHHIFFWDTIQFAGKHGHWFYNRQFSELLLPAEIDSGHPPTFGWYIALVWMLFGKSLSISHWAMYPFLLGIIWQLYRLAKFWLKAIPAYWFFLVVLVDPVFLGQSILVSPDIVLLFFFLLGINSLWRGESFAFAFAGLGLVAVSTRGMMIVAAFGIYEMIRHWPQLKLSDWKKQLSLLYPYLPAAIFSLSFLLIHYLETGWIGYHPDSPWAPAFDRVGAKGVLRNLAIFSWRWLDFGRVFLWLVFGFLLFRNGPAMLFKLSDRACNDTKFSHSKITILLLCLTILLSFSFLTYNGLQAHRYLLPAFLLFNLLCVILVDRFIKGKKQYFLLFIMFFGLASGNFWIYPDRIAQGWDATIAHWPYYALRDQMLDYLEQEAISLHLIGTAFPDIGPLKYRDLSDRTIGFKEKDLASDQWIFYSNIMNDFSDVEIAELRNNWIVEKEIQQAGVKLILYRKE